MENEREGEMTWRSLGGNNKEKIGGNSHLYSYTAPDGAKESILVDAGSMFAEQGSGLAAYIPNPSEVLSRGDKPAETPVKALVLTHGHQDHIGAIGHYVNMGFDVPDVYGPPLALALVKQDFANKRIPEDKWPEMHEMEPGKKLKIGNFEIEPVPGSHSIPQMNSLVISSPAASVFHSGDIKADQSVYLGPATDFGRLKELGDTGKIDAVMLDSTRATSPGATPPESEIRENLTDLFQQHEGQRIIVGVIGSAMERMSGIAEAAAKTDRTLVVKRNSAIDKMLQAGQHAGIDIPEAIGYPNLRIVQDDPRRDLNLDPGKTVYLATGTQGETNAALYKAATQADGDRLNVGHNDVVIISQSAIPGNETNVENMVRDLRNLGAEVITSKEAKVHASGHGSQEDLKAIFSALQPKTVVPIHGSAEHIQVHSEFIEKSGFDTTRAVNGDTLRFGEDGVTKKDHQEPKWLGVVEDAPVGRNGQVQFWKTTYRYTESDDPGHTQEQALRDQKKLGQGEQQAEQPQQRRRVRA